MRTIFKRYGWLLGAVVVVLLALMMVRLGFWQLDRLQQRRALNERILSGLNAPPGSLAQQTPAPEQEFQRVTVRGVFDHAHEFLLAGRSLQGQPGYHVVTPLRIEGRDEAVLINRGWVPINFVRADALLSLHEPGVIELQGVLRRSQRPPRPSQGPGDASTGQTAVRFYMTIEQIQQTVPYPLLPLYVERETVPAGRELPVPSPTVSLGEGSHLSYAMQWFTFAAMAVVGYSVFFFKERRRPPASEASLADGLG